MSKDTFHAAFNEQKVAVFANSKTGIREFLKAARSFGYEQQEVRIGVESTGIYHLLFCRLLTQAEYQVFVINPLLTHRVIASSSLQSVKNDRKDAIAVRATVMMGKGYPFSETQDSGTMRSLFHEYAVLTLMQSQCRQQAEHQEKYREALLPKMASAFPAIRDALEKERRRIQKEMKNICPETQALLRSIPGIGEISAAVLIAYVGNIERFPSARALVAYCGMACRVQESGTSVKGKGFLTKRGHSALRSVLFNAAYVAKRHNPECKAFFEKKIKEGKHYFVALCATERKLIHQIYAVWKRDTPYVKKG